MPDGDLQRGIQQPVNDSPWSVPPGQGWAGMARGLAPADFWGVAAGREHYFDERGEFVRTGVRSP